MDKKTRYQKSSTTTQNYSQQQLDEMIRKRAQEICNQRGCTPGNELGDWFEAEKQIKKELRLS